MNTESEIVAENTFLENQIVSKAFLFAFEEIFRLSSDE